MSFNHLRWAWETSAKANVKLVLLCLANFANDDDDTAWPSLSTIGKKTGLSRSTIIECLDKLESENLITRDKGGPKGRTTTRYRLRSGNQTSSEIKLVRKSAKSSSKSGPEVVRNPDPINKGIIKNPKNFTSCL